MSPGLASSWRLHYKEGHWENMHIELVGDALGRMDAARSSPEPAGARGETMGVHCSLHWGVRGMGLVDTGNGSLVALQGEEPQEDWSLE